MSKYKGIDERKIKCSDKALDTIEAGISFDLSNDEKVLIFRFHFLENKFGFLDQQCKSMHLDKETIDELIEALEMYKNDLK